MNCKPGELAIVVGDCAYLGHIFRVLSTYCVPGLPGALWNPFWRVEGGSLDLIGISDSVMRPLRPPEDVVMVGQSEGISEPA